MSEILERIRSGGHWRVLIRPANFERERVTSVDELCHLLERTSVRFRGRAFPVVRSDRFLALDNYITYEEEDDRFAELWRFYQSGQFIQYFAFIEDRLDPCKIKNLPTQWQSGLFLDPLQTLFRMTEIFELATRLTFTSASDSQTHLEVSVNNILGRKLTSATEKITALPADSCHEHSLLLTYDYSNIQLVANNRDLALQAAHEVFKCFGWNPSTSLLRDFQTELIEKSPWVANVR